jgi:hypothetical protein
LPETWQSAPGLLHESCSSASKVCTALTRSSRIVKISIPRATASGWPETPRQRGDVGSKVWRPVLLEYEVRRGAIEKLLGAVVQRLSPYNVSFVIRLAQPGCQFVREG